MDYLKGWKPTFSTVEFHGVFRPKNFIQVGLCQVNGEQQVGSDATAYCLMFPLFLRVRLALALWRVRRVHRKLEKFKARHNK